VVASDAGVAEPFRTRHVEGAEALSQHVAEKPLPGEPPQPAAVQLHRHGTAGHDAAAKADPAGGRGALAAQTSSGQEKDGEELAEMAGPKEDDADLEDPRDDARAKQSSVPNMDGTGHERSRQQQRVVRVELPQGGEHDMLSQRDASMMRRHADGRDSAELVEEDHSIWPWSKKKPKPVNCEFGEWGSWGSCSKACGQGEKKRTRGIKTEAKHGGTECTGISVERNTCQIEKCTTTSTTTTTTTTTSTTTTTTTTTLMTIVKSGASRLRCAVTFLVMLAALAAA